MKKNIFLCFVLIVCLISCNREGADVLISVDKENRHTIPVSEALSNLSNFENTLGYKSEPTKADAAGVQTIKLGSILGERTKSFDISGNLDLDDPVLYVVPLNNENCGYALLAADDRLETDLLAYVESGTYKDNSFSQTSQTYDTVDDDITEEEYRRLLEEGYVAMNGIDLLDEMCRDYCYFKLYGFDDDYYEPRDVNLYWEILEDYAPMLRTAWGQDSPFNASCPNVGVKKNIAGATGCFPTALGQLFVHNKFPTSIFGFDSIDYNLLGRIYKISGTPQRIYNSPTPSEEAYVGRFLYQIGLDCKTRYFSHKKVSYGFTWPEYARQAMEHYGYENVKLTKHYDEELILYSIRNNYPVVIAAVSGATAGHAWIIDGYKNRRLVNIENGDIHDSQLLVHCNLGWVGYGNGYYLSNVFKLSDIVEKDFDGKEYDATGERDNYNKSLRTITYEY